MRTLPAWPRPLVAGLIATVMSGATAEVAPYLEEVTVTASQPERPLLHVGASVSVMTGESLRQLNRHGLAEALRNLPGVTVTRQGGAGALTSVRLRGEEGYRTRLMMDGIPLSDVSAPQAMPRFELMMGNQLERVEVLRGPQGLIYGADAGGVVSVFSRQAERPFEADITMEGGGLQTFLVDANVRGHSDRLAYSVSGTDYSSRGFNARLDDLSGEPDGAQNTTWHGTVQAQLTDRHQVHTVLRHVDSFTEYDNCFDASGTRSDDCSSSNQVRAGRAAWRYTGSRQNHEVAYVRSELERQDYLAESSPLLNQVSEVNRWIYQGAHRFGAPLTFTWGLDHLEERYRDYQYDGEGQSRQTGGYFEGLVSISERFHYNLGVRRDHHEEFGGHTNYRFSAAYLIPLGGEALKLKGAWGTGFRAPSLMETNNQVEGQVLQEERSEGVELGMAWLAAAGTLEMVVFGTDLTNRIDYDFDAGGYRQVEGTGRSRGVELSVHRDLGRYFTLSTQYTHNQTQVDKNVPETQQRPLRPRDSYSLGFVSHLLRNRLHLGVHYRGAYRTVDIEGEALNNYQVLDLNASWQWRENLQYFFRAQNVGDAQYQEVRDYRTTPRTFYGGVKLSF